MNADERHDDDLALDPPARALPPVPVMSADGYALRVVAAHALLDVTCARCGAAITPDGQGSWVDDTDGDGCDDGVHGPAELGPEAGR